MSENREKLESKELQNPKEQTVKKIHTTHLLHSDSPQEYRENLEGISKEINQLTIQVLQSLDTANKMINHLGLNAYHITRELEKPNITNKEYRENLSNLLGTTLESYHQTLYALDKLKRLEPDFVETIELLDVIEEYPEPQTQQPLQQPIQSSIQQPIQPIQSHKPIVINNLLGGGEDV